MAANPSLAEPEPEHGKQFVETASEELAERYRAFVGGGLTRIPRMPKPGTCV